VGPSQVDGGFSRPAELCRDLLEALEATEGRRRRRKRDTTPDFIGIGIKRELLEAAIRDDPEPETFEGWLVERCLAAGTGSGPYRAMALVILEEWKLAGVADSFRGWLRSGAPSDDKASRARADGSSVRLVDACRRGAGCLALVAVAVAGCGGEERAPDGDGAAERLELDAGSQAVGVAEAMRGEPGRTIYDGPPELALDPARAAPGAASGPDPTRRGGLSADSLARVGGRPPPAAPTAPVPANPTVPPAARDTATPPTDQ
jgi:hypothetical protein